MKNILAGTEFYFIQVNEVFVNIATLEEYIYFII